MKKTILAGLSILAPLHVFGADGGEANPNRLSIGTRAFLNARTSIRNQSVAAPAPTALGATFEDGFVLRDISGNAGGQTWNFGYTDSAQISAGALSFDNSPSPRDGRTERAEDESQPGFSIEYGRALWRCEPCKIVVGANFAFGLNSVQAGQSDSLTGTVQRQRTSYAVPAGALLPEGPYSGSFAGPGPLIAAAPSAVPAGGAATVPGTLTSTVNHKIDGDMYAFRFGPFAEMEVTEWIGLQLSAGLAVAHADLDFNYRESFSGASSLPAVRSGSANRDEWMTGWYAEARLNINLDEHLSLFTAADFTSLDKIEFGSGSKQAVVDLRDLIGVSGGLRIRF